MTPPPPPPAPHPPSPRTSHSHSPPDAPDPAWPWWVLTAAFILSALALRVALLAATPIGLAGDEAHYWEWAQRLDWSYPTKGPGVALAIAGSTALLGDQEWAVRLPAAISAALTALFAAIFASRCVRRGSPARAALAAAVAATVVPAFLVTGVLMTIDAPYIACWTAAAWLGWELLRGPRPPARAAALGAALGLALGVGFLFKYTVLLLPPGLILFALLHKRRPGARALLAGLAAAIVLFALATLPVWIWNAREGWPTVAHLLGHLGLPGGDKPPPAGPDGRPWSPLWLLEFLGAQLALLGPLGLAVAAALPRLRDPWANEPSLTAPADPGLPAPDPAAPAYLLTAAAPIILFYVAVALATEPEANWPIAGYATLAVLAGLAAPAELARYRGRVRHWLDRTERPRPKRGFLRRKPETLFQIGWHWSIGAGALVALALPLLPALDRLPIVGDAIPLHRAGGHGALAARVARTLDDIDARPDLPAPTAAVTLRYDDASRLAYALAKLEPHRARRLTITSVSTLVGDRPSAYDFWPETDPDRLHLAHDVLLLVGSDPAKFARAMTFERVEVLSDDPRLALGIGYTGPTTEDAP
mgnify:FL=1